MIALAFAVLALASGPPETMSTTEAAAVQRALNRGVTIYLYDQAAWVATDQLVSDLVDPGARGIRGWIVEGDKARQEVTFYSGTPDQPVAAYRATVIDRKVTAHGRAMPDDPELSSDERAMIAARATAVTSIANSCVDRPYNSVVLPPDNDHNIDVYLLPPQTEKGVYPFGGHHLIDISAQGKIVGQRDFTKSCLALPVADADGKESAALVVTHLLDSTPTEIHVFLSLWIGKPIYVFAGNKIWSVDGSTIRLVDKASAGRR